MLSPRRHNPNVVRQSLALLALLTILAAGLWLASTSGANGTRAIPHQRTTDIGGAPQAEPNVCTLPTSHNLDAGNTDVGYFGATLPVTDALTNVADGVDRVWFHDRFAAPGTQAWKFWSPRAPAAINDFTELTFGEPYFVFSDTAQTWTFVPRGPLTEPTSVDLVAGDNNVVYFGGPVAAASIPAVSHIWRLDGGTNPGAEWGLWAPSLPASVRAFDTLDFADAYFINVTAPATWEFPPCDVAPPAPPPPPDPEPDALIDISGNWTFTITVTVETGVCSGETGVPQNDLVSITQDGTTLSVSGLGGANDPWIGDIADRSVTFGGTRPEDGGLTTAVFTMILADGEQALTGTEAWSWTGPGGTCPNSASDVTAQRVSGP